MNKSNKFSPEVRERAVRLIQEHRGKFASTWAAIESIAPKIGCVPQTLEMATGTRHCKTRAAAAFIERRFEANAITRVLFPGK